MYRCNYTCWRCQTPGHRQTVEVERHPVAYPVDPPTCPECQQKMTLGSFTLIGDPVVQPPKRTAVRRRTKRGTLPLFPGFGG